MSTPNSTPTETMSLSLILQAPDVRALAEGLDYVAAQLRAGVTHGREQKDNFSAHFAVIYPGMFKDTKS